VIDAVVVGSGPNGLAGAVRLARAGHSVQVFEAEGTIGGGTRTEELTVPGVLHDVCSAAHPFAVSSPYLRRLPLAEHGLVWCHPELDVVHPLDGGRAAVLTRSIDDTAGGLGEDGRVWRRTFGRASAHFDDLLDDVMGPIQHVPHHPIGLARFGTRALLPATWLAHRFATDEARALLGGVAAHAFQPLTLPTTGAIGLSLVAAAHAVGWPVARGGSRSITDALASLLRAEGGTITTGVRVTSLRELPPHRVALLDVSPRAVIALAGDELPPRVRRAYARYRYGPAACKVDLAVEGDVPWLAEPARRAGTVHLGGSFEEIVAGAADVHRGRLPDRPFVLVGQQHLADPTRSQGSVHPLWSYAHVPAGFPHDATEAILGRIEQFAPGFREQVVGCAVRGPASLEAHNANYVGGDISTGANDPRQLLFRPRIAWDPYATGIPGTFVCSAATPPGGGVHGMAGFHAAGRALAALGNAR
jgi:phytoene dehydrogenase-like protein